MLEAVIASKAEFTMIELGAGYGRWSVNAAAALRHQDCVPYKLIAVEPEPTHFEWMKLHFKDNGVDRRRCKLMRAAVAGEDGPVWFYVGKPAEWYGQAIAPVPDFSSRRFPRLRAIFARNGIVQGHEVKKVKAVSLDRLLKGLRHVDLIDLDVQGAELVVLSSAVHQLSQKVKRVHIGTHGAEIEAGLRTLFQNLGWSKLNDYACGTESDTPWGVIKFGDGVQTWVNPKLT